jgi:hypothetical protein
MEGNLHRVARNFTIRVVAIRPASVTRLVGQVRAGGADQGNASLGQRP